VARNAHDNNNNIGELYLNHLTSVDQGIVFGLSIYWVCSLVRLFIWTDLVTTTVAISWMAWAILMKLTGNIQ